MEKHSESNPGRQTNRPQRGNASKNQAADSDGKVGSDVHAAEHFADRQDFGIPAEQAQPKQQTVVDGSMDNRPLGTRMPSTSPDGLRENGVGAPNSGPGSGSGGDIDPDFVGVGTGRGLSASPERRTTGPDMMESVNEDATFGPASKGENQLPPGQHGTTGVIKGTVHDRMDREVHLGTAENTDGLSESTVDGVGESIDRSNGDDVDDREAATGSN